MKILLIGPQGSGKTTQAKILSSRLNLCLVKMGDLIREFARGDFDQAEEVRKNLNEGEFVDDKIVGELMKRKLAGGDCRDRFIVDGYPRRISQLEYFNPKFDVVFCLNISDEESFQRLINRGRADDTPELIKKRIENFHKVTGPVIGYYKNLGILININAEKPVDQVTESILNQLKAYE